MTDDTTPAKKRRKPEVAEVLTPEEPVAASPIAPPVCAGCVEKTARLEELERSIRQLQRH